MHLPVVAVRASLVATLACAGCASLPAGRSVVDSVHVIGARELDEGDVSDKLATTASPKFLGLFRGVVYEYAVFDAATLQRDLARVERYYQGHGFLEAHARTARVIPSGAQHVRVEIVVEEGPSTTNRRVRVDGLEALPAPIGDAARAAANDALPGGARFDEEAYKSAQAALARALTDRGYAYAKVDADAQADLRAHAVDYVFTVRPGPAAVFGPITIAALGHNGREPLPPEIEEAPLRRAMHIRPGTPYSTTRIESATQAVLDLKVFSSAQIVPELPEPPGAVVPLTVEVQPTKLRSVRLGVGAELDQIKAEVHGLAGWEDLNFLGDLRDLSVDFKPGAVFYPTRVNNLVSPTAIFPEGRLRAQFRQHGFIEPRTSLFIQPEVNVYPLLLQTTSVPGASVPPGYLEPKGAIGVDRRFGRHFFAKLSHNAQVEVPFAYVGQLDSNMPSVLISFAQLTTTLDYRDDVIRPHSGVYLANDLQAAGIGGNAQDVRIQPEVRGYVPLARGVTLAARGSVGLLFAFNYGETVQNSVTGALGEDNQATNRDIELTYFRGFYSGGPASNRGYPLRGIAPHGLVPFLFPPTTPQTSSVTCDAKSTTPDPACLVPVGGFTLWEASVEVRFDVSGPFSVATFCDAGDVSPKEVEIRGRFLHLSCGAGMRYATPVGPVRLDIGYRIQPLQVLGYPTEAAALVDYPTEGVQPTILHVPLAVAFGLGEAF